MADVQQVPLSELTDVGQILRRWEEENVDAGYDPIPILSRLAEIVESEMESYMKVDPDPFDERHPSRADPNCHLGHVLKVIFKKDPFMNKLVNDYLRDNYWSRQGFPEKDDRSLNIAACRLVLDVMPGLETSAVFQTPDTDLLITRLFGWAEKAIEPLQSYAVGLLAAAMEIQDTAAMFREQNARLVPLMLNRLHRLQEKAALERLQSTLVSNNTSRPFAHLNHEHTPAKKKRGNSSGGVTSPRITSPPLMSPPPLDYVYPFDKTPVKLNGTISKQKPKEAKTEEEKHEGDSTPSTPNKTPSGRTVAVPSVNMLASGVSECSNSSWAEMESFVIANVSIHPLTLSTRQMLTLRYLTPMGEYQEFLSHIFENNALALILEYTKIRETKETRLGFEALKYLSSLLCHKKVSTEFISMGGLQNLLEVPRPSVAATGVSMCFYYLAYCEEAMERVCLLPHYIISDLVSYALWLLECSHDSGRCHATMFFSLSFQFRVILEEFDAQDGLRKLYNVISTLPILSVEDLNSSVLNEDEECSNRQIVRHVTVALKRYYEAHLYIKSEQLRRTHDTAEKNYRRTPISFKTCRGTSEEVQAQIEDLLELMPVNSPWPCVDEFVRLGGITLLLQIIAFTYDWNFSGRAETVHSALNVLAVCAVRPGVQLVFCERLQLPDEAMTIGMNVILGASEGEIVADPDVQKAALQVIINCVCSPIHRVVVGNSRFVINNSTGKKDQLISSEQLIEKMWESVRENNGIIVLLMLMMIKTPITDADSIRALACRALAGLARCEKVRQIVSKLPVLSNGSMQVLLRDPILQEKRQEHVQFQKYYLELIEHITGKNQPTASDDVSLPNIHRANVVAQTRIQYNKSQLYQLIYQQLMQDGMHDTAMSLQKEANISPPAKHHLTQTKLKGSPIPTRNLRNTMFTPRALTFNNPSASSTPTQPAALTPLHVAANTPPPIKLNLATTRKDKMSPSVPTCYSTNRSLQKQTSWDAVQLTSASLPTKVKTPQSIVQQLQQPQDRITLDSIVTEYLTNQHALCKNPMVTCPQFNLFMPHRCPEPKHKNLMPMNLTARLSRRQAGFRVGTKMDNRLAHSRFCPVKTFRLNEEDAYFTCCEFLPKQGVIAMGTYAGEVRLYNLHTGAEEAVFQCHDAQVYNIQSNRTGELMLTSSSWRNPLSALWRTNTLFDMKLQFDDEEYIEFSKISQDRLIGTKSSTATIYDVETGNSLLTLAPRLSNTYSKNRATYNPTDELILTDGVLFDVNSGKEIHKFDKLNSVLSGVFHPNGLEIVSNTEIWDLRTFHLLRTVAALDHQHVLFSPPQTTIYTYSFEQENDEEAGYESSFKTLDSLDYSSIATIEVKKSVFHMACNKWDTQIAVVENVGEYHSTIQESYVRVYDVGRRRDTEEDAEEEDDDDDMGGSEDGSNSQSVSDNDDGNDGQHRDDVSVNILDLLNNVRHEQNGRQRNGNGDGNDGDDDDDDDNDEDDPEFVIVDDSDDVSTIDSDESLDDL